MQYYITVHTFGERKVQRTNMRLSLVTGSISILISFKTRFGKIAECKNWMICIERKNTAHRTVRNCDSNSVTKLRFWHVSPHIWHKVHFCTKIIVLCIQKPIIYELAILRLYLVIFLSTTLISFTKLNFRL